MHGDLLFGVVAVFAHEFDVALALRFLDVLDCDELLAVDVEREEVHIAPEDVVEATSSERGAADEKHSLELWSAHFDSDSGYMWVYYSAATYDANGNPISQSADIPSLWTVEKNETGEWVVVGIKEHP